MKPDPEAVAGAALAASPGHPSPPRCEHRGPDGVVAGQRCVLEAGHRGMHFHGELPPPEAAERDKVLERLARLRRVWLKQVREALVLLYRHRVRTTGALPYVTANDAREIFEQLPDVPLQSDMSRSFLGAVFRTAEWQAESGLDESTVAGSHARRVFRWRYVGHD